MIRVSDTYRVDPTWHDGPQGAPPGFVRRDRTEAAAMIVPPLGHRFDANLRCYGCGQHYDSHQRMRLACPMPKHASDGMRRESRRGRKQYARYERAPMNGG